MSMQQQIEAKLAAIQYGQPRDRRLAGPVKRAEERAFRRQPQAGVGIVDACKQRGDPVVARAAFDADGTLRNGGKHILDRNRAACHRGHVQPVQARHRKERRHRHAFIKLAKPRLHVSAELDHPQVGTAVQKLRPTAQRRSADNRPGARSASEATWRETKASRTSSRGR